MIGNRRFAQAYERARKGPSSPSAALAPELEALVSAGLVIRDGCVFAPKLLEASSGADEEALGDKTGLEAYVNHIHVGDYVGGPDRLVQALLYIDRVAAAWRAAGNQGTLRIVVSWDEEDCTVRFYLLRPGEVWLDDDLENYEQEAVGYVDVRA